LANYQIRPKFRLKHGSDQTLKPNMISTSLLLVTGRQSVVNDAIDEWCKRLHACICAEGRYFEHLMRMFTFLRSEEKSSDFL